MLDNKFCELLEYKLSMVFKNSADDKVENFWCDGILLPASENEYSKKFVNDNRQVAMTAFIGLTGQDKYELILKFGNKSLSRYARDLDISECLPNLEMNNYFGIDLENQRILMQLD